MDGLVMTAQIILSLSILVGLHELGHLLAAKFFGMRVEQFSIGFPPKIVGFKYGETEYSLSAIPLGGYVKISGMIDESLDIEAVKEKPKEWEFRSKPAWQRLIVMLAGIFVNIVLGVLIFIGMTYFLGNTYLPKDEINRVGGIEALEIGEEIGLKDGDKVTKINGYDFENMNDMLNPEYLLADDAYYTVERNGKTVQVNIPPNFIEKLSETEKIFTIHYSTEIGNISKGSIADKIGLKTEDVITAINGKHVNNFKSFATTVKSIVSDSITIEILRGKEELKFTEYFKNDTIIGVQPTFPKLSSVNYSFSESIVLGTQKAFGIIFIQIKAFKKMFRGDLSLRKSISGPIGIAKAYGGDWQWERFWRMTGLLSMVLAFMNLLPIPALDGGHVVFLTFEMLSGKVPSVKIVIGAQKVGMIILLALMVFLFGNDIYKLFI